MREMTGLIKKIPLDKFSNELRIDILRTSRNHPENKELSSLFNIVNCELTDTAFKIMLEDKNFCYPKNQIENIEILARINDIKFIRGDKNKLDCIKKSVNFYFITHKKTNDLQYLIRALELIRKVKSVFEQKLNEFENIILQIFYQLDSSYYQVRLIENSSFLMQDKSLNEITEYSLNQLNNNYESNNYSSASDFITILNKLKYFDKNKFKIQMAICFEKEGDFYISKKNQKHIIQLY